MKENSDGFVRADQIDLKSLDEQLERHLNKVRTMDKSKRPDDAHLPLVASAAADSTKTSIPTFKKDRQEWEIDPSKLIIKSVIARGTFGTVHRGIYDGQDVAGQSLFIILALFFFLMNFVLGIWRLIMDSPISLISRSWCSSIISIVRICQINIHIYTVFRFVLMEFMTIHLPFSEKKKGLFMDALCCSPLRTSNAMFLQN